MPTSWSLQLYINNYTTTTGMWIGRPDSKNIKIDKHGMT